MGRVDNLFAAPEYVLARSASLRPSVCSKAVPPFGDSGIAVRLRAPLRLSFGLPSRFVRHRSAGDRKLLIWSLVA